MIESARARLKELQENLSRVSALVEDITEQSRAQVERKIAEEALAESEERLRMLVEYSPDTILISDSQGNIVDGNTQAEALTGCRREELI